MNKRQKLALETKQKLVDSAILLLKEKGFEAINVEEITKKAGVAKGTFYSHFNRKEDIVIEISRSPFRELDNKLKEMQGVNFLEKITYYFKNFMILVESFNINICREWIKDVINPSLVPDTKDGKKWFYDIEMLKNILLDAIKNNELKQETPIELFSNLLISELYGMTVCWCMSDGIFEPLEWTKKFCETQLDKIFEPYIIRNKTKWRKQLLQYF